jgi:hypothetical protein
MKKIEQIAKLLLQLKVSFNYSPIFLEVKSGEKIEPFTATYHADTGKLILMDDKFHATDIESVLGKYIQSKIK